MHDELGAAAQRGLPGGVHVADDHVRLQALLQQRLGTAVDGDDHGAHVADEGPQRTQVALVLDAAYDDQRRAVAKVGGKARQLDPAREQLALLAHVLDRVVREALERLADLAPARLRFRRARARGRARLAAREQLPLAQHLAGDPVGRSFGHDDEWIAVGEQPEQLIAGQVDEQDARLDQQLRAEVRIGA